jgi:mRNA-degrading endonuclease toxin of MazEF toxin-antitoxin module
MTKSNFPKKGEIWLLRNPARIKEIGKDYRPVLIISNNERNEYDNSVVVLPTTTDDLKNILPIEVYVENTPETGLAEPSKILCDSPFTWDKGIRFEKRLGVVSQAVMAKVKIAWQIAFDGEE